MSSSETSLKTVNRGSLPMMKLALPLIGEQFFRILVSSVDTFMLSSYSEAAVAGVGLVSQWVFFIQILINVVCIGSSIVLAQYLGAKKDENELNHVAKAGFVMVLAVSAFLTVIVLTCTPFLLNNYTLEEEVYNCAKKYFMIYSGTGAIFAGISSFQTALLRTYGYTKETLIVTIISNIINVIGNALALYGWFGLPVFGAAGVAVASTFSVFVGNILLFIMIRRRKDIQLKLFHSQKTPRGIYKLILSIGIPTAGESLSYNLAQITIMAIISTLGTYAMDCQVYTQTIVRFVFVIAAATGNAVQIKVGYYVGAGEKDTAYKKVFKYSLVATICSLSLILLVNLVKTPIIHIFTRQDEVFALTSRMLVYSILIEFGRSLNLIYVGALKGSGDVKFPVLYGILSMWGIMVFLSWFLGLKLGLGVIGCWLGIGLDETTRGIVMLLRWKGKRWQSKALVKA